MKKEKLNLTELKIESFVTKLSKEENETVNGGLFLLVIPAVVSAVVSYAVTKVAGWNQAA